MKLLLIEDEPHLLETMRQYLSEERIVCETAADFSSAVQKIHLYEYDCVVVDINLPDGNGLDLVRSLKQLRPKTGIVIVSARNAINDRIAGLEYGADDYLVKPFDLAELNARIKSVVRRVRYDGVNVIEIGSLRIFPDRHAAQGNGTNIDLTPKEFELLLFFVSNTNRVITKEMIAEHLWGDYIDQADSFDFVYAHIKNLRKKLQAACGEDFIKNVYGVGYKLAS